MRYDVTIHTRDCSTGEERIERCNPSSLDCIEALRYGELLVRARAANSGRRIALVSAVVRQGSRMILSREY